MANSVFADKSAEPSPGDLETVLGPTHAHWDALLEHAAADYAPLDRAWIFPGAKWGWSLRLKQKKRTVLYMTPAEGHFVVGFAMGERAVAAAHEKGLPGPILRVIESAPRYPEGRAVRVPVKTKGDLEDVLKIAAVKMST